MRLSISAKIFVGFLVVLATFCGVEIYGGWAMRGLGDELRLVSRGYLELRIELSELQTAQSNLIKALSEQLEKPDGMQKIPRVDKFAVDDARRSRLTKQMPRALEVLAGLEPLRSTAEEHALLAGLRARFERVSADFRGDEELFDEVYGPIGDVPLARAPEAAEKARSAGERLLRQERMIQRNLMHLSAELRLRAQQSGLRLEEQEGRTVWIVLLLAIFALAVGIVVAVLATRLLRPLRRLAEGARRIALGEYKQRVDAAAPDEIGALAREFNQMAQALDEREQALIRSERLAAVGKIAAQITHEVRNPLSSIGLNAEMLEEELTGEAQKLARAIVKEVDRLTEITEEYLRFARLPRPKLEREDLRELVTSLLVFMKPELESRKIELDVDFPPLPQVAADEHQLRQALLNLLRNAAEAMRAGGKLRVAARALPSDAGRFVELRISDTGQGIAPEHLAKIFDPFFSTKEGGTGLGLALTQQIIVEHGGAIGVESEPGRGTTFTVRLVALDEARAPLVELAPSRARE